MIGSTHILQDIDVSSLETLHRVHIENAIRKAADGDKESQVFVMTLWDCALRRPLAMILQFVGWDARLSGTMGNPVQLPYFIKMFHAYLKIVQRRTFESYLVIPYNDEYLRVKVWADYVDVAREWL